MSQLVDLCEVQLNEWDRGVVELDSSEIIGAELVASEAVN
jgi:hypothetical protein